MSHWCFVLYNSTCADRDQRLHLHSSLASFCAMLLCSKVFLHLFTYCLRQAFPPWLSGMGHYMSHSSHHSELLRLNKLWLIHRMSSDLGTKQTSPIPSTAGQADNRRVSKLSKLWASTTERKRLIRRQNVYFYRSSKDLHNKWFN